MKKTKDYKSLAVIMLKDKGVFYMEKSSLQVIAEMLCHTGLAKRPDWPFTKRFAQRFVREWAETTASKPKPKKRKPRQFVQTDGFLKSADWRRLRYLALKQADGRCTACGASAKDGVSLHVDHIKPRYSHPELALCMDNLQILCEDCNLGKGAWDQTEWNF